MLWSRCLPFTIDLNPESLKGTSSTAYLSDLLQRLKSFLQERLGLQEGPTWRRFHASSNLSCFSRAAGHWFPERELHSLHLWHQHSKTKSSPAPTCATKASAPPLLQLPDETHRGHLSSSWWKWGWLPAGLSSPGEQQRLPDRVFQFLAPPAGPALFPSTLHLRALSGPPRRLPRLRLWRGGDTHLWGSRGY